MFHFRLAVSLMKLVCVNVMRQCKLAVSDEASVQQGELVG